MTDKNFVRDFIEQPIKDHWNITSMSDYKSESFTYAEVAKKIARLHIMFEACDVKKGDKIALIGKNSSRWAMVYLASVTYGAVIVPILSDFHANDIHHIINHSDSVALFLSEEIWNNVDENKISNVRAIINLKDFSVLTQKRKEKVQEVYDTLDDLFQKKYGDSFGPESVNYGDIPNSELGVISYTSGTTGFSKGVMLPLNSLAANLKFAWNNLDLFAEERIVSFLPLAHSFGCAFDFLWPFSRGAHIHFLSRIPTPQIILSAFGDVKPHVIFSVPLIMEKIYKKQILPMLGKTPVKLMTKVPGINNMIYKKIKDKLSNAFGGNFKEIILGGAPMSKEVGQFFDKIKFKYTVGYGMTECGPLIAYESWDKTKPGSAGRIIDPLTARIDSDDPEKKVGEIMVKGENVMRGYYKNPEATEKVLDADGWLHTGDLGIIDKDGFVFIRGRNKSMILGPSGENIYPEEIEAQINNMPYVQESVVISDEKNRLKALVYPDYEEADAKNLSDDDLQKIIQDLRIEVNKKLPKFKQISRIKLFPNEFEKTPKKSIKRFMYEVE